MNRGRQPTGQARKEEERKKVRPLRVVLTLSQASVMCWFEDLLLSAPLSRFSGREENPGGGGGLRFLSLEVVELLKAVLGVITVELVIILLL